MVTNKEIQLIAKELNLYNISNGTIDLEDEKVSNKYVLSIGGYGKTSIISGKYFEV